MVNKKRLIAVALFLGFLFSLLIVQFFKIQIIEGDKWSRVAEKQHKLLIIEPFRRGLFYSNTSLRKGHPASLQPLVVDVERFHLYLDPDSIPLEVKPKVYVALAQMMHLSKVEGEKLWPHFLKKSRSRKVAMWLDREKREEILEWWTPFSKRFHIPKNALYFVQDYKRSYPFGKLLGQILHTVREDRDIASGQSIPTGGLELVFHEYLKGKPGKRLILRSPKNPFDTPEVIAYPEDGADVYLTIDHCLQTIAEEEIEKAVRNANARSGWAIMMDPKSGEIFALAQYPFFNPAEYRKYFNDDSLSEETKVKAVTDPYEPGSTMKPITLATLLLANKELQKRGKSPLFSPQEKVDTLPTVLPGRSKVLKDLHNHHYLNMYLALQKSSNVYMGKMIYRVMQQLGPLWYRAVLEKTFGLGIKTGIEIPSESQGLLPTPGKLHPSGALEWSQPTPYSLAMGHNVLVNSMQMLRAYAIFANGGWDVKPTLVRKIIRKNREGKEEVLLDNTTAERVQNYRRLLDADVVHEVVKAMKFVTKPGGAAPRADIYGYTEAGKTGTSEKIVNGIYSKTNHIATFIGFAPVKEPRFVLLIAIDEPEVKYIPGVGKNQLGGQCAAPAFREIGKRALQYLGVEPDDPYGLPPQDPHFNPEKADWCKEARALKELYRQWNGG